MLLVGSAAYWALRHGPTVTITRPVQAPVTAPAFDIATAGESGIRDNVSTDITVFRLADNPQILVLDFASLHDQGMMLNRVAAFAEKAGMPHDRVLTDAELDAAVRGQGETVETFYLGHDYPVAILSNFFALADRQRIELQPQEEKLRALLRQVGWLSPDVAGGLISVPAVGSDPRITLGSRAAILRHELSHGEFFSNPVYADFVYRFWRNELTGEERAAVRAFLGKENYDVREEELMLNEMQAYLMFTRDPMFFSPELVQMTPARLAELQARFLAGMPDGWLRTLLAGYNGTVSAK